MTINTALLLVGAADVLLVLWLIHAATRPDHFRVLGDARLSRLIGVLINTDSLVGKDFEAGLAHLKTLTEGR